MEIIQKWKETKKKSTHSLAGSLSSRICSSQRTRGSNWATRFLTLLKGHLLLRQCKHGFSFARGGILYDCGAFFSFNNEGQCPAFIYFIPYLFLFKISF